MLGRAITPSSGGPAVAGLALDPGQAAAVLRAAVEASPVCVTIGDMTLPDRPLIFVNAAFERMTGYPAEEAIGRNCRFLQGAESDPATVRQMREAIEARIPFVGEIVNYRRDGTAFLNRLELAPLIDPGIGLDAYVGIQRDISAFREAERARREREKLAALGRLAAGFSHELNNLLQPIVTFADLLASRCRAEDPEASEPLRVILESARAARAVTAQVLRFARSRASTGLSTPVGRLVADTARLAARLLPPGVTMELRQVEQLLDECELDATELLQVFTNLFKNAADAMASGGHIAVCARVTGPLLVVEVSDTGPGMDEATAARIFEPFFTTNPNGTGLGLSLVWGIIQGWGGSITVETSPGKGARFALRIPLKPAPRNDGGYDPWQASC